MQPKLCGVDIWIKEAIEKNEAVSAYESKKPEIIDKFLIEEESLILVDFNIDNFDIDLLCYAVNCGLDFGNKDFVIIVKKIIICMIDIW